MPKRVLPLSEMQVSKAKVKNGESQITLFDGGGLFLLVTAAGGKLWRFKYRFDGKQKMLSFGIYPEITLSEAREKRAEARKQLAHGVDPAQARQAQKQFKQERAANSFEAVSREWIAVKGTGWSDGHRSRVLRMLEKDTFPWIGHRPISEILAPELLTVLRRLESRAVETAHRLRWNCSKIFKYAIATARADRDPAADLQGALSTFERHHFAAITDPKEVRHLLRAIDDFSGTFVVKCALRLAPLVFVRPGELRQAEWKDIDFDAAEWRYFVTKTKTKHIVPLSQQALEILQELKPLTGFGKYLFPSIRTNNRPMSENTINVALRRLGFDKDTMTGHGFRAMARTIMDEEMRIAIDHIEHQLAHAVRDANGRAYNRTSHLVARRQMMQQWADYLDELKFSAKVTPIRQAGG